MYRTKDLILNNILLINFDEEKKTYKENQIATMFADKNIDDKAIIIVCTQQSMSGTSNHFQESFLKWITRPRYNGIKFQLLSKVDATRQKNRISITGQKSNNVRTRIYYNPNKVNLNFDITKFQTSYNKNTQSRGGIRSVNTSWSNTRTANLDIKDYHKIENIIKIQLFDYSIHRLSRYNNNEKPIIGQGLIDVNLYFVYATVTGKYLMKFTVRNYNGYKNNNIGLIETNSNQHVSKSGTLTSGDEYKYTCSKNTTKEKIVNERHGKFVKIEILNKSNFPKPVQKNSQVMPYGNRNNGYSLVRSSYIKHEEESKNITNGNNSDNKLIQEVVNYTSKILYNTNLPIKNNNKNSEEYKKLIAICDNVLLISKLVFDNNYNQKLRISTLIPEKNEVRNSKIIFNHFINFKKNYSTLKNEISKCKSQNKYIMDFKNILFKNNIERNNKVSVFYGQNNLNKRFNNIISHSAIHAYSELSLNNKIDYKLGLAQDLLYLQKEIIKLFKNN